MCVYLKYHGLFLPLQKKVRVGYVSDTYLVRIWSRIVGKLFVVNLSDGPEPERRAIKFNVEVLNEY